MSSFTGKFREYPTISADNFEKENLDSLAFFLSHCHKDHMSGLDSAALHQRFMTSKNVFLYCSETTENLLMCNPSYTHLKEYIRSIPLEQQTIIPLLDDKTEEQSSVCVTLLPAGHCVGSVMFLFEGPNGNVLYTGDFRLAKGDVKRISFFHANGRIKDIKSVYIDTTFCLPKMNSLPSREQSRDAIIELIDRWFSRGPEYVVSLLCKGMYGFEYLLKEVAMNYKTKIHVSVERLAMYRYLPDMTPYFTSDGRSTRIHSCKWQSNRSCDSDLPCGLSVHPSVKMKVLRIKPTTMWVARDTEPMPADFKRYDKGKRLWRVVHSMHASMEEIQDIVGYLRPYHVYPNVPPAGLDSLEDAFERLKGLTRIQECDSCNQDESGDERFIQHAAGHFEDGFTESEKNLEEKAALRKLLQVARPAPDEKVLAQCKELGLDEDESLAPVPKRRKAKNTGIALEEKISSALQHATGTMSTSTDVKKLQGTEAQGLCSGTTRGDTQSDGEKLAQFDETTRSPSGTEMKSVDENRGTKAQGLCSGTTRGDRQSGGEKLAQFDETTRSPSGTDMRSVDENRADDRITVEQLSSSSLPESDCKHLHESSSSNSSENAAEDRSNGLPENNHDHFMNRNTTSSCCPVSSEQLSSLDEKRSQGPVGGILGPKIDFDVPPSPGHVEPLPDKLSMIHHLLQSGEPLSITKMLKF